MPTKSAGLYVGSKNPSAIKAIEIEAKKRLKKVVVLEDTLSGFMVRFVHPPQETMKDVTMKED